MLKTSLEVRNVNFDYETIKVLHDISFSIDRGEFVGIIGPNGSGKSTLLKNISRVLKPSEGDIILEGKDIKLFKRRDLARRVAVVPQDGEISFAFTAWEIVLMGRAPYIGRFSQEGERDREIAQRAMQLTDTWDIAHRPFTELSGGEKQRVIIARALTQEPTLLLLDEPTSHLDINYQLEIFDLIKRLNKEEDLTIIAVSHDLNLSSQYCDYLIMLNKGKIFASGRPEEVITADNIKAVYNAEVIIRKDTFSNRPLVIPYPNQKRSLFTKTLRVHIICGGGAGQTVISRLCKEGYKITVGALNVKDSDWELAISLGVEVVEEIPFSPIREDTHKLNLRAIEKADVVILTNIPIGHGNMKNLEAAKFALDNNIPLIIHQETPISERDFVEGRASILYNELIADRAKVVESQEDILEILENEFHSNKVGN